MIDYRIISIVLCTCDRAEALRQTLASLSGLRVPSGWNAELILVNNGSEDATEQLARTTSLPNMELRYFYEPRKGKSNALNTGLAAARGDIILFTDDDMDPAEDWIEQLSAPLIAKKCDAVTGKIVLPPSFLRPWLTSAHRRLLGSSEDAKPYEGSRELLGGSMGFRRSVLEVIDGFDPEIGPGGLGASEESFLGWQLVAAGLRIGYVQNAVAIHQLHESRLCRANWLKQAQRHGRSEAYILYHWLHGKIRFPALTQMSYWIKLRLRRAIRRPTRMEEGCALWEISYVLQIAKCKQYRIERNRPRNYSRRGLQKKTGIQNMMSVGPVLVSRRHEGAAT